MQKACGGANFASCAKLLTQAAEIYNANPGAVEPIWPLLVFPVRFASLATTACEAGQPAVCTILADSVFGLAILNNPLKILKKACPPTRADPRGCELLAEHFLQSGQSAKGVQTMKRACRLGQPLSCRWLGNAYLNGDGVKKNVAQGLRYLKSACKRNDPQACMLLGDFYGHSNPQLADKYYQKMERIEASGQVL